MADIFLSYASADLERIKPLAAALLSNEWTVFFDRKTPPGKTWRQFINSEIDHCRCMVVCWSEQSIDSRWVIEEADIGLERQILIPIFLDPVKAPFGFRSVQGAHLFDWQGNTDSDNFLELHRAIVDTIGLTDPKNPIAPAPQDIVPKSVLYLEPEMIEIPSGHFQMGSDEYKDEQPTHVVNIAKPFWLAKYPVTFDEYERFAKARKLKMLMDGGWGRGRRPVINVSWEDALAYAEWLAESTGKAYRLPTEAEWEYAARAGTTTDHYWGGKDAKDYAWFDSNSKKQTHPVGEKKPNDFGLYDMAGNVWEWVQDCWHENYQNAPTDGSAWEKQANGDCSQRVLRGGSWGDSAGYLRSAGRLRGSAGLRSILIGFRLAQD